MHFLAVETKASIAHPPESKEKKEDSKNVYSNTPPGTVIYKLYVSKFQSKLILVSRNDLDQASKF